MAKKKDSFMTKMKVLGDKMGIAAPEGFGEPAPMDDMEGDNMTDWVAHVMEMKKDPSFDALTIIRLLAEETPMEEPIEPPIEEL